MKASVPMATPAGVAATSLPDEGRNVSSLFASSGRPIGECLQAVASRASVARCGQAFLDVAVHLDVDADEDLEQLAPGGIDYPLVDKYLAHRPCLVACPGVEGFRNSGRLDQVVLQRQKAEQQVTLGVVMRDCQPRDGGSEVTCRRSCAGGAVMGVDFDYLIRIVSWPGGLRTRPHRLARQRSRC
jgi:hypothetical protein